VLWICIVLYQIQQCYITILDFVYFGNFATRYLGGVFLVHFHCPRMCQRLADKQLHLLECILFLTNNRNMSKQVKYPPQIHHILYVSLY
jgi:hypothetical protein